jgi:hypothetical protein
MNDAILILKRPFDLQNFAARDQQAVAVVEIWRDDDKAVRARLPAEA